MPIVSVISTRHRTLDWVSVGDDSWFWIRTRKWPNELEDGELFQQSDVMHGAMSVKDFELILEQMRKDRAEQGAADDQQPAEHHDGQPAEQVQQMISPSGADGQPAEEVQQINDKGLGIGALC